MLVYYKNMLIKIDYRENDLQMLCVNLVTINKYTTPIKIVSENLPLGDIIICDDDGTERVIIERKSLNDLAASICDGRYKEQSFRLNQCSIHNHHIYYLIEGQLKTYKSYSRIDKRALLSSMVSISYFKGFSIHKTNDMQESAEWILQFADKLGRERGHPVNPDTTRGVVNPSSIAEEKKENENQSENKVVVENQNVVSAETDTSSSYSLHMKRVKKNNITPENIGEIMLSQIPNVSVPTAISIMKKFKTITSLITSLQNDEHCLDDVRLESDNGKERKINKTSISSIRKYLLCGDNQK
jgi:ERCC4-type nuclease